MHRLILLAILCISFEAIAYSEDDKVEYGKFLEATIVEASGADYISISVDLNGLSLKMPVSLLFISSPTATDELSKKERALMKRWQKKYIPKRSRVVLWTPYEEFTYDQHGRISAVVFDAIKFEGSETSTVSYNELFVNAGFAIPSFTEKQRDLLRRFNLGDDLKMYKMLSMQTLTGLWGIKDSWIYNAKADTDH